MRWSALSLLHRNGCGFAGSEGPKGGRPWGYLLGGPWLAWLAVLEGAGCASGCGWLSGTLCCCRVAGGAT
eukprot:scaffold54696_cov18-Tisochrysis_lutea.AAC.1